MSLNGAWWMAFLGTARWIGVRLDTIAALTLAAAVLLAMLMRSWVQPQLLGLALTHVLSLTGTLQWWVRQTVEVSRAPRACPLRCPARLAAVQLRPHVQHARCTRWAPLGLGVVVLPPPPSALLSAPSSGPTQLPRPQ
jgi:hypothetical protein